VLVFRITSRRFDVCQLLLNVGARRPFLTDQRVEFRLMLGGLLQRRRRIDQLAFKTAPGRRGLRKLGRQLGLALRQSLDLGRDGVQLVFEVIARRSRLRQLDLELRLAFSQICRQGRHGRRVLVFRITSRRFDVRQLLLNVGARRPFLTD
jgi:hypothetical protein